MFKHLTFYFICNYLLIGDILLICGYLFNILILYSEFPQSIYRIELLYIYILNVLCIPIYIYAYL